ncbi:M56 family metallopeptidase [Phytohabitans suffuscus]
MSLAVPLPVALSLLLAILAPRAVRRTAPATAARGLVVAAVVTSGAYAACLLMLASTLVEDLLPLSTGDGGAGPLGAVAAVLLAWGLWRLAGDLTVRRSMRRRLRGVGRPRGGGLVVAEWDEPHALAVPGRPGHVLVTTGMLRALDAGERRAMLAHERAHLTGHHDRLVSWAAAAAAVDPFLASVRDEVAHQAERWADEDAAAAVGDRALVARAVARAALAGGRPPPATAGTGGSGVVHRVRALTHPPPDGGRGLVLLLALTAVAAAEVAVVAAAWLGATSM